MEATVEAMRGAARRRPRTSGTRGGGVPWYMALLLVMALALAACGSGDDPGGAADPGTDDPDPTEDAGGDGGTDAPDEPGTADGGADGGEITYAWARPSDVEDFTMGFQPNRQCSSACISMFGAVFDPLVITDPDTMEVVGVLAESWEVSEDGLAYTFTIKDEAVFHDGSPVTSEDVAYSLTRTVSEEYGEINAYAASLLDGWDPDGTEIVDDKTIVLRTEEPNPDFLGRALARTAYMGIVPRHAVEEMGEEAFGENPIGSGPYRFVEWEVGSHITVERNPDYTWGPSFTETAGGPPRIERINFVYMGDAQTRVAALRSGEVDGIDGAPAEDLAALDADSQYTVVDAPYMGGTGGITFNNQEDRITSELAVRRAISMALDREAINNAVWFGTGYPTTNFVTDGMPYLREDYGAPDYDLEAARQELDDAGWEAGADGIRERDGQRLELDGVCYSDVTPLYEYMEALLREVGVALNVECAANAVALERRVAGDFDLFTGTIGFGNDSPVVLHTLYHTDNHPPGWNSAFYSNPEVDELIDDARTSFDEDVRREGFEEAQRLIAEDVPVAPIVRVDRQPVVRQGVAGLVADSAGAYRLFYDLHLTE